MELLADMEYLIKLLSDRGSNFISSVAQSVYDLLGIKKLTSTAYHPETQGLIERFNGTLVRILKSFVKSNLKN